MVGVEEDGDEIVFAHPDALPCSRETEEDDARKLLGHFLLSIAMYSDGPVRVRMDLRHLLSPSRLKTQRWTKVRTTVEGKDD